MFTKLFFITLLGVLVFLPLNESVFGHGNWQDSDDWEDSDDWGNSWKKGKKGKSKKKHKDKHNKHKRRRTSITTLQNLRFDPAIAGFSQAIVTHPQDDNAAIFEATGQRWGVVTITVKERSIKMTQRNRGKKKRKGILINQFSTGGSLNRNGRGVFDRFGYLDDIRVGATANIKKNSMAGAYHGRATLRLVYQ